MRRSSFALTLLIAIFPIKSSLAGSNATAWEKFGEDDDISVFRRDMADSPIVALRGEGVVDAPILRVASVLIDQKRAHEWVDRLVESRLVRRVSEVESVEWNHIETPIVLKDRDFVFSAKLDLLGASKQVELNYRSVKDPAAPQTGFVRGWFQYGKFVLTSIDDGKRTRVLAELMCDPRGSVAKWIVNLFQKDWPHKTIEGLRAQVRRSDLKDDAQLAAALSRAGF